MRLDAGFGNVGNGPWLFHCEGSRKKRLDVDGNDGLRHLSGKELTMIGCCDMSSIR